MTVATVDELFTRERRERAGDRTALIDATGREYDLHWLCTTSWKAGNFLRHSGVRNGVTVGVVGTGPIGLLAFFGTALLEARTQFDPPTDRAADESFRTLVAPVEVLETGGYELPPGAQRVGYGDKPTDPDVHNFDAGLWSENPSFPPVSIDPDTALLTDGDRTLSHADALAAGRDVITTYGLEHGDRVVVRESFSDLRAVIAGVLAPLLADGVIVLAADDTEENEESSVESDRGGYVVSSEDESELAAEQIALERVSLSE
ncbi:hypothetical protein G6M89_10935 [Natronolimnobius sp. AArcel1]|uniref:hypothetical protein n=1 Tax=Natronolimnobius sp. AArcel1 TaxID=1679093 RepID=UPI0013ECD5E0|nr:hypothetical protein [Natronolimnobius sp. AArcel1]NGM69513.1 hypothetical protein [Natronolimnobius sp. AArcel1]